MLRFFRIIFSQPAPNMTFLQDSIFVTKIHGAFPGTSFEPISGDHCVQDDVFSLCLNNAPNSWVPGELPLSFYLRKY